jgi:DHA1 family tetracycline resistance protein-like MFS transporter
VSRLSLKSVALSGLWPLYAVVGVGFVGYSLTGVLFPPLFLHAEGGFLPAGTPLRERVLTLGYMLSLYPFGQFLTSRSSW